MSGVFTAPPFRPADIAGEIVRPLLPGEHRGRSAVAPFDYFFDRDWLHYDGFSIARELADGYARAWARQQEALVREMLGHWVSEIEPCLIIRDTHVVGIGMAGDPEGKIIIRPARATQLARGNSRSASRSRVGPPRPVAASGM